MISASVSWPEISENDLLIASNIRGAKATMASLSTPAGTVPTRESPVLWLSTQPVTSGQHAIRSVTSLSVDVLLRREAEQFVEREWNPVLRGSFTGQVGVSRLGDAGHFEQLLQLLERADLGADTRRSIRRGRPSSRGCS